MSTQACLSYLSWTWRNDDMMHFMCDNFLFTFPSCAVQLAQSRAVPTASLALLARRWSLFITVPAVGSALPRVWTPKVGYLLSNHEIVHALMEIFVANCFHADVCAA